MKIIITPEEHAELLQWKALRDSATGDMPNHVSDRIFAEADAIFYRIFAPLVAAVTDGENDRLDWCAAEDEVVALCVVSDEAT